MADVTITGLANASALTGAERVPMDQAGTTVDAAASAIAALATKATVGLSNVDNTSDLNKPISTATQTALDGKASTGAIGSSGLTMSSARLLGRATASTGAVEEISIGSGLSIVGGALTATGGGGSGTVTSVGLTMPTGFAVGGSPVTASGTLAVTFSTGYSLPTTASQASWDTAATLASTAVQPAALTGYVQTSDSRLSDARPWSAPISSTYTASGAISTSDRIALINSASAAAMTLGSGTTNGQVMVIKRYGAGSVTITANLDGVSNSSIVADSATIKESVTLAWSASLSTWLVL